jgi:hypothetical protein
MWGAKQVFITLIEKGVTIKTVDGIQIFQMPAACTQEAVCPAIFPSSYRHRISEATPTDMQFGGER